MILNEFKLNNEQIEKFKKYYLFLVEENNKINLTSITEENEVYIKHFYDSLKMKDIVDFSTINNFLDVGSGAGFPGIPLKIMYPHLSLTIIEPTLKRVNFLRELVKILEIDNVEILNLRAEDAIKDRRESFSVATARAVAGLPILLELIIPYLEVNGIFLAPKGPSYQDELNLSNNALKTLHSKVADIYEYDLPNESGKRSVIKIIKNKETEVKYPRVYGLIKKKHL